MDLDCPCGFFLGFLLGPRCCFGVPFWGSFWVLVPLVGSRGAPSSLFVTQRSPGAGSPPPGKPTCTCGFRLDGSHITVRSCFALPPPPPGVIRPVSALRGVLGACCTRGKKSQLYRRSDFQFWGSGLGSTFVAKPEWTDQQTAPNGRGRLLLSVRPR
jgi:hypothetical protein